MNTICAPTAQQAAVARIFRTTGICPTEILDKAGLAVYGGHLVHRNGNGEPLVSRGAFVTATSLMELPATMEYILACNDSETLRVQHAQALEQASKATTGERRRYYTCRAECIRHELGLRGEGV